MGSFSRLEIGIFLCAAIISGKVNFMCYFTIFGKGFGINVDFGMNFVFGVIYFGVAHK